MTDQLCQQVYDTVATHLLAQGRPAKAVFKSVVQCAYRDHHGFKCAVGCLIPDDMYDPEMEGKTARELKHEYPDLLPDVPARLLHELQHSHDATLYHEGLHHWARHMLRIALKWELDPAIIKTFLENNDDTP